MKKGIFLAVCLLLLLITGCSNQEEIQEKSLEEVLNEKNYIVVDVRTKEEYEEVHVRGALNIPYDEIDEEVALEKEKTILVYCRSGKRSNIAYHTLKDLGYTVIDLGAYDSIDLEKE